MVLGSLIEVLGRLLVLVIHHCLVSPVRQYRLIAIDEGCFVLRHHHGQYVEFRLIIY